VVRAEQLGQVAANSGLLAGLTDVYLLTVTDDEPRPTPEPQEAFGGIVKVTLPELRSIIAEGKIRDGFTLSALMLASARKSLDI
jgi:hypothetical protein